MTVLELYQLLDEKMRKGLDPDTPVHGYALHLPLDECEAQGPVEQVTIFNGIAFLMFEDESGKFGP